MSFQSQGFYEKLGYKVDFERSGYVNGSSCLFLQLALSEDRTKAIKLVPYDKDWPKMFETEAIKIRETLGQNCVAVHHIGSTSVPALAAKPKIDITTVVKPFIPLEWSVNTMTDILGSLGYTYKGEWNIPFKYGFTKRGDININLHVYEEGHPEIEVSLLFRDYLRKNDKGRDEYAALKDEILKDPSSSTKTYSIFPTYTLRKNDFILNILKQNGFKHTRFVKCAHYNEVQAAKYFRQKYFFDNVPIKDPYTWTFNHPDHVHFILYQGALIIGYGHIRLCSNANSVLRIIVIDQEKRNQGFGGYFLQLIEKWLKNQNYRIIHAHSSPKAIEFYKKYNYYKMPFNDPDGYESDPVDIPVGKNL
ncbi:MAG: GNAT family N-acetyltransferase [Alphaproteobacteria bacterium]|nr:GNAT family N-acetyltransferase [Alphaproteobacteria bacterium]NDE19122.1 GNAT family N-acetyltransferase [Alphaproteobacteria bacterium]